MEPLFKDPDEVNRALMEREQSDPDNWRVDQWGDRYYVGPRWSNDGTIEWSGDGWPE